MFYVRGYRNILFIYDERHPYCGNVIFSPGFISLCILIFLTDCSKCCIETSASEEGFAAASGVAYFARYSCSTRETEVLATAETSAPLNPSVTSAILLRSISRPRGLPFVCISRIFCLVFTSGFGTYTILSNRPGLNKAESIMSTLLVAARTTTP